MLHVPVEVVSNGRGTLVEVPGKIPLRIFESLNVSTAHSCLVGVYLDEGELA